MLQDRFCMSSECRMGLLQPPLALQNPPGMNQKKRKAMQLKGRRIRNLRAPKCHMVAMIHRSPRTLKLSPMLVGFSLGTDRLLASYVFRLRVYTLHTVYTLTTMYILTIHHIVTVCAQHIVRSDIITVRAWRVDSDWHVAMQSFTQA